MGKWTHIGFLSWEAVMLGLGLRFPDAPSIVGDLVIFAGVCGLAIWFLAWMVSSTRYQLRSPLYRLRPDTGEKPKTQKWAVILYGLLLTAPLIFGYEFFVNEPTFHETPTSAGDIRNLTANIEFSKEVRGFPLPEDYLTELMKIAYAKSEQSGKPMVTPSGDAVYLYHNILVNLSKGRRDWSKHITVELRGASCIQLERFTPTRLEIKEFGSQQIKVDVYRTAYSIPGLGFTPNFAWLIRDGFAHDALPLGGSNLWEQTGWFGLSGSCVMDIAVLVDGRPILEQRLRLDSDDKGIHLKSLF